MKLVSDELCAALCEQIGHEKYNANLYLYMAGFLKNKGFNNISKHFEEQHDEETGHSKIIFDLLTDLNSPVVIPEIDEVFESFPTIIDLANAYLIREVETTDALNKIKKLAISDDNPVVEERIREMLKLQQHEYAEATDYLDKATLTGGDWKFVFLWDLGIK